MSAESRPDFLRSGRMMACFWRSSKQSRLSDALTTAVMYGIRSTCSRSKNSIGSRQLDLTGNYIIMRQTSMSASVHSWKDDSNAGAVSTTFGGTAAAVPARILSTRLVKNAVSRSAVWLVAPAMFRTSNDNNDRQEWQCTSVPFQTTGPVRLIPAAGTIGSVGIGGKAATPFAGLTATTVTTSIATVGVEPVCMAICDYAAISTIVELQGC